MSISEPECVVGPRLMLDTRIPKSTFGGARKILSAKNGFVAHIAAGPRPGEDLVHTSNSVLQFYRCLSPTALDPLVSLRDYV